MFKLAAHNWMRPEPLEVTLARLSRLGYEGIEIMGEPARYQAKETRALLKKHKVNCWGAVSIMLRCRDLIHADYYLRLEQGFSEREVFDSSPSTLPDFERTPSFEF